jgi:hypothetical protein
MLSRSFATLEIFIVNFADTVVHSARTLFPRPVVRFTVQYLCGAQTSGYRFKSVVGAMTSDNEREIISFLWDRNQLRVLVNTVMNLWVPLNVENS